MAQSDQLITSTEAGQILGRSGRTVSRLAESGSIPFAHKLPGPNGAYLFRRDDIEAVATARSAAAS